MYKTALLSSALLLSLASTALFSAPASADEQLAASLCNYTADNNKNQLRKTLAENRIRLRNVYDGVFCNGENLIRHAIKSNAADAAGFIVNQLPASQFSDGADINWAEGLGLAGNDATLAVKSRAEG